MGKSSSSKRKSQSKQRQLEEEKEKEPETIIAVKDNDDDQKVKVAETRRKKSDQKKPQSSSSTPSSSRASAAAAAAKKDDGDNDHVDTDNGTAAAAAAANNSFESLTKPISLCRGILDYCAAQHFTSMTPVQAATIPLFLSHKDVAVQALTGSGKTLAFIIPIVECLRRRTPRYKRHQIGALVLSPTRELAHQTHAVACQVVQYCRKYDEHLTEPLLLVGGGSGGGGHASGKNHGKNNSSSSSSNSRPVTADLEAFQRLGTDIWIGTPGRVEDILTKYAGSNILDCSELDLLILDECDVLLDLGFATCLQKILQKLPKMRRTGLFSATTSSSSGTSITSSLKEWIKKAGMRNPVWIDVAVTNSNNSSTPSTSSSSSSTTGETDTNGNANKNKTMSIKSETTAQTDNQQQQQQATPTSLTNYHVVTPCEEKLSRLVAFLKQHQGEKIIVFFLTCACVEFYGAALQQVLAGENSNKNKKKGSSSSSSSNICIETLHGKLVQKRREKTMERFRGAAATVSASATAATNAAKRNDDDDDSDSNDDDDDDDNVDKDSSSRGSVLFCTDVAARGLDVSNVHWVVQFDAPQDPAFYIHRVGRCARAGRQGSSLLFLTPKEEAYIDFLHNRKVPLVPLSSSSSSTELCTRPLLKSISTTTSNDSADDTKPASTASDEEGRRPSDADDGGNDDEDHDETRDTIEDILPKVRDLVMKDRDLLEKGTKAFTSYIRAYKEHRCAFIFRFASLDLGVLATSFCLLRLPKMPELRDVLQRCKGRLPNFTPAGPEVDIYAIAYQDRHRETARQKRLAQDLASGGKSAKLILAEKKKAAKERQAAQRRQAALEKGRNPDKKRSKHAQLVDDWDEFTNEERLYKKLRKGKITKEEYDDEMYGNV